MITTREINVILKKGRKLERTTTKDVDASVKVEQPKKPVKPQGISTQNIADVADITEKKRRDDIAKEKKIAMAEKKKPWNKMNAKERKEYQIEKAKKEKK